MARKKKEVQETAAEPLGDGAILLGDLRKVVEGLGQVIQTDALVRQYGALNFGRAEQDDLYVFPYARNGAIQVVLPVALPQELDGVAVDGVSFCSFVRSLKQGDDYAVQVWMDDTRLGVKAGRSSCFFSLVDGSPAPATRIEKLVESGPVNEWVTALNRCRYTTAKGRGAGVFCGVHADKEGTLYSTDRFRCSRCRPASALSGPFTLPSDCIDYLVKQFSSKTDLMSYAVTADSLVLRVASTTVICSLLGGTYPPVGQKFAQVEQQDGTVLALSDEFRQSLDQHIRMQQLVSDPMDRRTEITVGLAEIEFLSRTPGSELRTKLLHTGSQELAFSINPESLAGRWDSCWINEDGSIVRFSDDRYSYIAICK